jgi:hypothetical protein
MKSPVFHIFLCCCLSLHILAQDQRVCGFDRFVNPMQEQVESEINNWIKTHLAKTGYRTADTIRIPVVFHVLYNKAEENLSDEKILEQLNILNQGFNGGFDSPLNTPKWVKDLEQAAGFYFCLVDKDPWGNPSSGITRTQTDIKDFGFKKAPDDRILVFHDDLGGKSPWSIDRYMNIYIANLGTQIAGYATLPWGIEPTEKGEDGVVINYSYVGKNNSVDFNLGRVAVHEAGHYFNLLHPWGEGNCFTDDGVQDTPRQRSPYTGCPTHPKQSCGSEDLIYNSMDYVFDSCAYMFTKGQVLRMHAGLALYRPGLLNHQCSQSAEPVGDSPMIVYPNPLSFGPLIIRWQDPAQELISLEIFSMDGRKVDQTIANGSNIYAFECTHWPIGMYIILARTKDSCFYHKISKTK